MAWVLVGARPTCAGSSEGAELPSAPASASSPTIHDVHIQSSQHQTPSPPHSLNNATLTMNRDSKTDQNPKPMQHLGCYNLSGGTFNKSLFLIRGSSTK
jgi:hypothetical protein